LPPHAPANAGHPHAPWKSAEAGTVRFEYMNFTLSMEFICID